MEEELADISDVESVQTNENDINDLGNLIEATKSKKAINEPIQLASWFLRNRKGGSQEAHNEPKEGR